MNSILRGAKNVFRNSVRLVSVTLILSISIGLALVMLVSYRTVSSRIETVKSSIGNTITVNPAGSQGFQGGGEPLTMTQMINISDLEHVSKVSPTLSVRLIAGTDTSLIASIEAGTLGNRQGQFDQRRAAEPVVSTNPTGQTRTQAQVPRSFTPPIMATGISDTIVLTSGGSSLTAGEVFAGDSDQNIAVVGKVLAEKNSLNVGSVFTAYGTTMTVQGIYDAGNQFANSSLYMPLKTAQRLSGQTDEVSAATVNVDSVANLDTTMTAIKTKLGTDKVDLTSSEEGSKQAITPLENVKNISFYSLIGSLIAGAIITLLVMMMIVRERRREIGVLKAIGASNATIVAQFVSESLVFTLFGSVGGVLLGILLSNPILSALVSNSTSAVQSVGRGPGGPDGGGLARLGQVGGVLQSNIQNIHAVVSYDILLYGLLTAIVIAIIGSAIPAWLIAKVRPAEVMRGE